MTTENQAEPQDQVPGQDDNKIIAERRAKLAAIREQGIAFPNDFRPEHKAADLQAQYAGKSREELEAEPVPVVLAGRMMLKREAGKKAAFATLQDSSGKACDGRIQIYVTLDATGEAAMEAFRSYDLGDILGVKGTLFKTKTDELTVKVSELRLITKSLRPLPDKFHGLADQETKYRQRYVDLIMNEETRRTFKARTAAISSIRRFMQDNEFMEVETPMLHAIPGGAAAKPFVTHHNALDMEMYLRIAPELYLKRLVVGGFDRVFEINRNFRNEGVSIRHNPEFTMLEFYAAYTDYQWIMNFTEAVIRQAAVDAHGSAVLTYGGRELDLSKPFHRLTIVGAINKFAPHYTNEQLDDAEFIKAELKKFGVKPHAHSGLGALQLALFEETAEAQLWEPTFIIDYPEEVSPLARASDTRKGITERFELFMVGREIANGFSELNDAEDQSARFLSQVAAKEAGDDEAMYYDADYIRALEYGMPPAGGCGIGIDRLIMLLTDSPNIRDVLLFPHLRKED
ncbi:lysine--tRNA ligase [Pseudoduganella sp. SL102]|uniref:Lysine--tRNA ligase n=1 Tax=Pseudoduganella albidiflava TaxID=321983 RepID=A0A411WYV1_9BURK|nr:MULTISPECIES: lysine--tRNA ligase [Pseudoduganella]QBI01870.1 lysine--tRNA ligase [Pseudoduganella albidiflava]WBR99870.1 lysine--tRNA ligase [Pseudoduganella sp. SL102]GGY39004.1 lysine--tRNA ligase [Pseudoduganella albidiflava]